MLVLRTTDRIPVTMGEITLWVSPMSLQEKAECVSKGSENQHLMLFEALKCSIKEIDTGDADITFSDGSPVEFEFQNGRLTDESLEILAQIVGITPISNLSSKLITGLSDLEINGVKVDPGEIRNSKKKK